MPDQGHQQGVHHLRQGTVRERASKNPKLPTGDIEVVPEKIEVLGQCRYNELPFEINRSREADETPASSTAISTCATPPSRRTSSCAARWWPRCARP